MRPSGNITAFSRIKASVFSFEPEVFKIKSRVTGKKRCIIGREIYKGGLSIFSGAKKIR
jgi:hypothetical protein